MKSRVIQLLTIWIISFSSTICIAETYRICEDCQIKDFATAYSRAKPFDTILIDGIELTIPNTIIEKSLTLLGKNGGKIHSLDGGEILTIAADSVHVENLIFSGVLTNYLKENAAIRILRRRDFVIQNNQFDNCFFAIYLEKARNGIVVNNRVLGNATKEADSGNGVHAWYCKNLVIQGNEFSNCRDGIYFEFVDNSQVLENYSHHNLRYGLHFMFSNDDEYRFNTFESNGAGVAVMFSRRIEMTDNLFYKNWGTASYGLLLKEIYDAEIINNRFIENTIGIFVEGSNRINYNFNEFRKNGWAIKFSGGCDDNKIVNNNFMFNSLDMLVTSGLSSNEIKENYWSDYNGYDLDKDGFGDIPFYPVKLFSYVLNIVPESVVLMRSMFIGILNYAEKVSPVFTPKQVFDPQPSMTLIQ